MSLSDFFEAYTTIKLPHNQRSLPKRLQLRNIRTEISENFIHLKPLKEPILIKTIYTLGLITSPHHYLPYIYMGPVGSRSYVYVAHNGSIQTLFRYLLTKSKLAKALK